MRRKRPKTDRAINADSRRSPGPNRGFFISRHADRASPIALRDNAPMPTISTPRETWMLAIALGILYAAAIAASWHAPARSDELYHFAQIELFRHGDWRVLDTYLTTIPGYNAVVAAVLAVTRFD